MILKNTMKTSGYRLGVNLETSRVSECSGSIFRPSASCVMGKYSGQQKTMNVIGTIGRLNANSFNLSQSSSFHSLDTFQI